MECTTGGFYLIKDQYFIDYPDPNLKQNKGEHRPFYFCFEDKKTGLYWMIPLSSSANKIRLAKRKISEGKADVFHLTRLGGKDGVMLIADMCPVTPEYIAAQYRIDGVHVVYKDTKELKEIRRKAIKVLSLLRRGVKFSPTQPDIFDIERRLIG